MTIPRYLLTLSNAFVIRGVYSTAVRLSRPKTRDRKLPRMALFFSSFGITLAHMVHYFGHAVSRPVNFIVHCREPSVVSCAMRFTRIPIFFPIYVAASCHSLREISLGRSCPIYRSDIFSWVAWQRVAARICDAALGTVDQNPGDIHYAYMCSQSKLHKNFDWKY